MNMPNNSLKSDINKPLLPLERISICDESKGKMKLTAHPTHCLPIAIASYKLRSVNELELIT